MRAPRQIDSSSTETVAAEWLARCDRGLSPEEEKEFRAWLNQHPEHAEGVVRLQRVWSMLDVLRAVPHEVPAPPESRRGWKMWSLALAVAAAVALMVCWRIVWVSRTPSSTFAAAATQAEWLTLADGSLVELRPGASIDVTFTANRRSVRLLQGEAQFHVTKDAARPFVVAAAGFAVRAVGTAFSVQLTPENVSVLVTEGQVQLNATSGPDAASVTAKEISRLVAGQEAVVRIGDDASADRNVQVRSLTSEEMERALAWQVMRLEFVNTPLREVAARFNRFNGRKLLIEDDQVGAVLVGGSFRPDNIEAFVRLLETGFGVRVEPRGHDFGLRRR